MKVTHGYSFGEQHFTTDFLYQTEWQEWLDDGTLSKLDVAFSRDTDQKVYVQHKIAENSEQFNQWIENGAAIYVCGDERVRWLRMFIKLFVMY